MLSHCNTNPLTWITAKLVWITKIQTLLNHRLCSRRMYTVTHPTITKLLYNPVARPLPSSLTWVPLHGTLFPTPVLLMSLVVLQTYVTIWSLCGLLSTFSGLYLCRICFLYEHNTTCLTLHCYKFKSLPSYACFPPLAPTQAEGS